MTPWRKVGIPVGREGVIPVPKGAGVALIDADDDTTEEGRKELRGREAAIPNPKSIRGAAIEADDDTTEEGRKELEGREAAIPIP